MDVKDVLSNAVAAERATEDSKIPPQSSDKTNPKAGEINSTDSDAVLLEKRRASEKADERVKANTILNIVNVTQDATKEIGKLVMSIKGIVQQAQDPNLPESRRSRLEKEANDLVQEIKKTAEVTEVEGVKPLAGDPIRFEIEKKIGRTLEVILPEDAREGLGLGTIELSTKDSIINTIVLVQEAQRRLDKINGAVQSTAASAREAVNKTDVAAQNSEASEATLRDLDSALRLAGTTRIGIAENPENALGSSGLSSDSLRLLD